MTDLDAPQSLTGTVPIVCLGVAAGGAAALRGFFTQMPAASGLAFFVLAQPVPELADALPATLHALTPMPVIVVDAPVTVAPNQVYLLPARHQFVLDGAVVRPGEPAPPSSTPVIIDLGFRVLADALGPDSVAVVLSGAGTDGALGLPRVKERGGLTIVQLPEQADHDSMPRSALATGFVDYLLPVEQMPAQLLAYRDAARQLRLPDPELPHDSDSEVLNELFVLLRARTGHNFSHYKRSTVLRRIARRMQVNVLPTLTDYLTLLHNHPQELQALLRDLLISVTNFFRDPAAFTALAAALPAVLVDKAADEQVRIWVAACATGEEAYSVAILVQEQLAQLGQPPAVQIFATDIDEQALAVARHGLYSENIVADVSPDRLRRFFTAENGGYRIRRELRDMVIFAPHNLLRDPPFSRLDLITCRNLLIYLDRAMQERVLELFHFVLRPSGRLLLGSSESADGMSGLFSVADKQHRIYARRAVSRAVPVLPNMPLSVAQRHPMSNTASAPPRPISFGELHQQLLEQHAPPSLLVDEAYEIVHMSERVGRFLQFVGGEPSYNLLKVAHPALRMDLRAALFRAAQHGRPSEARRVSITLDARPTLITIVVRPVQTPESGRGFLQVLFDERDEPVAADADPERDPEGEPILRELDAELQRLREQLRDTVEQYEASTEELRISNEELHAMNEELRSTTEELETSQEELQSVNEELLTVNQELKSKVDEVTRANSDVQNLMASTDIGTIFLDRELRVKRFTPRVQELFNLIATDVNRPLSHVTNRLNYLSLLDDAAQVFSRLAVIDREVQHHDGRWFLVRVLPYRTTGDQIDGVVLTFVDISRRKAAEDELRASQQQLNRILDRLPVGVVAVAATGRVIYTNSLAEELLHGLFDPPRPIAAFPAWHLHRLDGTPYPAAEAPLLRAIHSGEVTVGEELMLPLAAGGWLVLNVNASPIRDGQGEITGGLMAFEDITLRKQNEALLRVAQDDRELVVIERAAELEKLTQALRIEVVERRRLEGARQALLRQLVAIQEEERRRISREIHDQIGQQLFGLGLGLRALREDPGDLAQVTARLEQLQSLADALGQETRQLASDLRPTLLDDMGLVAALSNYAEEWTSRSKIALAFHASGIDDQRFPSEVETTIYRAVLEALTNVLKHAEASSVSLILEQRDGLVIAIVEDNGKGFDAEALSALPNERGSLGLLGMQERVELAGGVLTIESTLGGGTTIFVRVPVPPARKGGAV